MAATQMVKTDREVVNISEAEKSVTIIYGIEFSISARYTEVSAISVVKIIHI